MNIIAVIILVTIVIDFILNGLADILNIKMLKAELPEVFSDVYDAERYRKSQEYLRVNTRYGWITSIFGIAIILVIWFGKGFPLLDQWVRAFDRGPIVTGLMYMGVLVFFKALISLPFSVYATFVIEERFGFNKTTWKTFILDMLKGLILSFFIGVPLLAGVLAFFQYAGNNAWWICWVSVTLFMFIIQYVAPRWIMPLFNQFDPIEDGELKDAIMEYARSIKFSLENVFVMDGSKRSSKSNAFFTGFGKNRRIVLFDTLIKENSISELVAVLAHEMGHYKKKHIFQTMAIGILQMGIMFFFLSFFISFQGLFDAFYMSQKSVYAGMIFFGMLYSPIDLFVGIFMQMFSRKNEYTADRFAVETTGKSEPMITALKKLSANNLSNLVPHPFYVFLNYSHPPVLERINAISLLKAGQH
jgi:STE24 endopeptidase